MNKSTNNIEKSIISLASLCSTKIELKFYLGILELSDPMHLKFAIGIIIIIIQLYKNQTSMKSKQSLFQQIVAVSTRKAKEILKGNALKNFEERLKLLPTKIKQLDASPYMFIFEALAQNKQTVDFTFTQYQTMIEENFLNPDPHAEDLVNQFRRSLDQHSFIIIQIIMKIKAPNLIFFQFFFEIHRNVAMPDNVLVNFKYTGYRWLSRCFSFKKCSRPSYIDEITSGMVESEIKNLPSAEDFHKSIEKYVGKVVNNMVLQIEEGFSGSKKFRYGNCFMCAKGADYYCKDTKVPVCSSECKKAHINYISNNPAIDFLYGIQTQRKFEHLLIKNLKQKKNLALTTDYLCSVYTNSEYKPFEQLPHRQLLFAPIIIERVWHLYLTHYQRRGEIFEHIFADCLKSSNDYIKINAGKYFVKIAESNRILEIYNSLDFKGFRRIFPIILNHLDADNRLKFIESLINLIYNSKKSTKKTLEQRPNQSKSMLLRKLHNQKNPIPHFIQALKSKSEESTTDNEKHQKEGLREAMRFIIKNQQQIDKKKICDFVIKDKKVTLAFLQELLLPLNCQHLGVVKNFQLVDEILREVFYFININVSDQVYSLLEILWELIDPERSSANFPELSEKFSLQNTETKDTLFQILYLILMIVTQFNNTDKSKKSTAEDFVKRIRDIDKKFINKYEKYIIDVYGRVSEVPYSQTTRGILTNYPIVKSQDLSELNPHFILIENWELIYECIMGLNNDTIFLYRICTILVDYPHLCNSFMQLLLNKIDINNTEEHLIPSINGILQQEPNCVGSSWSQLFYRNSTTNKFLFDLSVLVHYSKSLKTQSFIWFARQFCKNVSLSQNLSECEKLLSYNFASMNMYRLENNAEQRYSNFEERVGILNKQMIQLFSREKNIYYQLDFMKQIFKIGDFSLAMTLLDIIPINIVTANLILYNLTSIVKSHWKQISDYLPKTNKFEGQSKKEPEDETNKIWTHIIKKVLMVIESSFFSPQSNTYFNIFSETLRSIPECYRYFQSINIERAISISYFNRQQNGYFYISPQIHKELTEQLSRFSQHIPQMDDSILNQFINEANLKTIIQNFAYFCHLDSVYELLLVSIAKGIVISYKEINEGIQEFKNRGVSNNSGINQNQISLYYLPHYLSFLFVILHHVPVTQQAHILFKQSLESILSELIIKNLRQFIKGQKIADLGLQFYKVAKILYFFTSNLNTVASYALLETSNQNIFQNVQVILELFSQINSNHQLRIQIWEIELFQGLQLPPGMLQQQSECQISIFKVYISKLKQLRTDTEKNQSNISQINQLIWGELREYLQIHKEVFMKLKDQLNKHANIKKMSKVSHRKDDKLEYRILNQRIRYCKLVLQHINLGLTGLPMDSNNQKVKLIKNKINSDIIDLMDEGFDFYECESQGFQINKEEKIHKVLHELYLNVNGINEQSVS